MSVSPHHDAQPTATPPEICGMRHALQLLLLCVGMLGCGARIPIPTLSLHALWQLTHNQRDTQNRGARDLLLALQLTFETRASSARRPRTPLERELLTAGWEPLPGTCSDPALCEWASLAEEATLTALGVPP